MPHKTDQKVNKKQSKSRLCKIKIHQSRYQKQILARQTSPPSFNLDKNGRHQHPRNSLPWPTPQHWSQNRKHTPAPKIRLHLQQSIISAEINHNSEPLFFKTEKEKEPKKYTIQRQQPGPNKESTLSDSTHQSWCIKRAPVNTVKTKESVKQTRSFLRTET